MEESLKALIIRNNDLLDLLSKAGIEVPPFIGPKLLRCVVAVQKSVSDENNANKSNSTTNGCVVANSQTADANQISASKAKQKEKKAKKTIGVHAAQKIVLDRTFGQRRIIINDVAGSKKLKTKANLQMTKDCVLHISENSSLETISILEQSAVSNHLVVEDRTISVLPLFSQQNGSVADATTEKSATVANTTPSAVEPAGNAERHIPSSKPIIMNSEVSVEAQCNFHVPADTLNRNTIDNLDMNQEEKNSPSIPEKVFSKTKKLDVKSICDIVKPILARKRAVSVESQQEEQKKLRREKEPVAELAHNDSVEVHPAHNIASVDMKCANGLESNMNGDIELQSHQSPSEIANELLDNLQMTADDPSHGSLSPTAAFLLSFPVVSSVHHRAGDTEQVHQLSPSETGLLDMDTTNDQQLLDNISSLFTQSSSKILNPEQSSFSNEKIDNGARKPVLPIVGKPSSDETGTKTSDDLLNLSSTSIQTVFEKPRELYESQTFAEILESLKASPSKPRNNNNETNLQGGSTPKHSGIPDFSFSANFRTTNFTPNAQTTSSVSSHATAGGFYETLSSIKPITYTRGISLPAGDSAAKATTTVVASTTSIASSAYSVSKLTKKHEYQSNFILPPVPLIATQSNHVASSMLHSYSPMTTMSSYATYNPVGSGNSSSALTVPQSSSIPTTTLSQQSISSSPSLPKLSFTPATTGNKNVVRELSFPSFAFGSSTDKKRSTTDMGNQPYSELTDGTNQKTISNAPGGMDIGIDSVKTPKKTINWMTSEISESKVAPHNYVSMNSARSQPYITQSLIDDSVQWSPNRLLDPSATRTAPMLPALHGDLSLHTIGGENPCQTHTQKYQLNTPVKVQQPLNSHHNRTNDRNVPPFAVTQPNFSTSTYSSTAIPSTANFFSVSQLVDDAKDRKKTKTIGNRQIEFSHTTQRDDLNSMAYSSNDNNDAQFIPSIPTQPFSTPHASKCNSTITTTSTCGESYSISNVMTEPMKTPSSQHISSSYSTEALLSSSSSIKKKSSSSFIASNSLSLEFYNPADSLMDFSTSNEIFNPYIAHSNFPLSDNNFTPMTSSYTEFQNAHHHCTVDSAQSNFDLPPVSAISMQNNHSIANITQNSSSVSGNFQAPLSLNPTTYTKDSRNVTSDATMASSSMNSILGHSSTLTNVMPSQAIISTNSSNNSAYLMPSFKHQSSSQYSNHSLGSNNGLQYRSRHSSAHDTGEHNQKTASHGLHYNSHNSSTANGAIQMPTGNQLNNSSASHLTNFNLSTIFPEIGSGKNSAWRI